jgi:hypothetical protein
MDEAIKRLTITEKDIGDERVRQLLLLSSAVPGKLWAHWVNFFLDLGQARSLTRVWQ